VAWKKKTPKKCPVAAVAGGGICLKKAVKKGHLGPPLKNS
jgi:hypothetical protein